MMSEKQVRRLRDFYMRGAKEESYFGMASAKAAALNQVLQGKSRVRKI